jgi:hypothetical protein
MSVPGIATRVLANERELLERDTNMPEWRTELDGLRLDAVVSVTPYHPAEELLLRAAAERSMPLCAPIISFDNPTTRNWLPARFDRYLVWNRYNADQILRSYPELDPDSVRVVGAPQFDFYWDDSYLWPEDEWRSRLGLPGDRPVILFGGGPSRILPHEPNIVEQLDDALESGEIPGAPVLLFRRHPMDPPDRWDDLRRRARHIVFDDPWPVNGEVGHSSARRVDVEKLVSTLAHGHVHVNTASTMTVDGAVFDRPQIGPAYDDRPGRPYDRLMRELYDQEHWLPIARSDGIDVARDRDALVRAVVDGFESPKRKSEQRRTLVSEIISFTDGRATERVVDEVCHFLGAADKAAKDEAPLGAGGGSR